MTRESLRVALLDAAKTLADAGVGSAQADAELLAAHLMGVPRTRIGLTPLVESDWVAEYRTLIARRAERVPLQHITGVAHLGDASVRVGPGVFTPRPETELLLEWSLDAIADVKSPLVVDLCTGSGIIAIAIAKARPDARVIAVERSTQALAWARCNAEDHEAAGGTPVKLRGGDVLSERLLMDLEGTVDLVTVNPPYVPADTPVEPEVSEHDPAEAVFAGAEGLDLIRPLITVAATLLKPGGWFAMEHDDTQGVTVPKLMAGRKIFADVAGHVDLNGRPRLVTARRVALAPR